MADIKLIVPPREPYEAKATIRQRRTIWELGCRDQVLIESLGRKQAEKVIQQLGGLQGMVRVWDRGILAIVWGALLLVVGTAAYFFFDTRLLREFCRFVGLAGGGLLILAGVLATTFSWLGLKWRYLRGGDK